MYWNLRQTTLNSSCQVGIVIKSKCIIEKNIKIKIITLGNKILAHERFIVFVT